MKQKFWSDLDNMGNKGNWCCRKQVQDAPQITCLTSSYEHCFLGPERAPFISGGPRLFIGIRRRQRRLQ